MTTQELFSIFESDIDNFIELTKEDLNDISKDIKKNKKNTVATLKAILNMKAVANDTIKTSEIYFNSSILQNINEFKNKPDMVEIVKNYLNSEKSASADVKQKRGIVKEVGSEKDYLKSGFYLINEVFGNIVEYFAIIKNIAHAADIPEDQKPALILENLNSMLAELLSIEITVKDNISAIIINEIKKEEAKIKKAV
jgi:ClpP class serine protease